jgi:RNA polymerase sigma-70 factor (ECF subfamily)
VADRDPDREMVEQAQSELPYGTSAYNRLVRRYSNTVYQRSYRILRSQQDAEEASQEVFMAVYRHLRRFRFERPFSHWLSTITLNACRMILRRRAQEQRRMQALAANPQVPADAGEPGLRRLVLELLDALEAGTRIPLLMRFVEGYTYAEIAEQLELSESAAKMRVSRGAQRLRELYWKRVTEGSDTPESSDG